MKTTIKTVAAGRIRSAIWTLLVAFAVAAPVLADDPPGRVGRLNFIEGSVSFQPPGAEEWTPATANYPVTNGERFWTDGGAEAEIHVGRTALQLGPRSDLNVIQLTDQISQVGLSQGVMDVRVRDLDSNSIFEVDTPGGAVSFLRAGFYRIDVDSDGNTSKVTVRQGLADVTADGSAFNIDRGQEGIIYGGDNWSYDVEPAPGQDEFDDWATGRDRHEDDLARERYISQQYVSPDMTGWEDLAGYGAWQPSADYGQVWYPTVAAGWAPYSSGHWAWVAPWGWTWVDSSPWGFAPFHYGRWAFIGSRWGWVPGAYVARPYYAPALVAFVGFGGARPYGWFPLGPREVWVPGYAYSAGYIQRVNYWPGARYTNVNIYNVRYVNRTVPGAVCAVGGGVFASGRLVDGRVSARLSSGQLVGSRVTGMYPPVVPTRQSVLVGSAGGRAVAPPSGVSSRAMIYKTQPPGQPVAFSRQVSLMKSNPGKPLDTTTLSRLPRSTTGFKAMSATTVTAGGLKPRGEHTPKAHAVHSTTAFRTGETGNPRTGNPIDGASKSTGLKSTAITGSGYKGGPPSGPPRTLKYSGAGGQIGGSGSSGVHGIHHRDTSQTGGATGSSNPNVSSQGNKHKNRSVGGGGNPGTHQNARITRASSGGGGNPNHPHHNSNPSAASAPHAGGGGGQHSGAGQGQPKGEQKHKQR